MVAPTRAAASRLSFVWPVCVGRWSLFMVAASHAAICSFVVRGSSRSCCSFVPLIIGHCSWYDKMFLKCVMELSFEKSFLSLQESGWM
ncbi:unnamed protein product [Citrullus colocynthis]|uniref:Secreted protein n=1 Tax=Citrullus colocynthis TaxID=252529 RepID=A0ABP0Y4R5_9ROSI